tara:strand:+ start:147 stop:350 length:204 start_codon:yes stop_codon:yes gene_type:complete
MIESFLGISIALSASLALFTTIALSNKVIKDSGSPPLSIEERRMIQQSGYTKDEINSLEIYLRKISL